MRPGEITPVEVEILPSSTLFESASSLQLDILGRDAARYPAFKHGRNINRGRHAVHTGGAYPSALLAPLLDAPAASRLYSECRHDRGNSVQCRQ